MKIAAGFLETRRELGQSRIYLHSVIVHFHEIVDYDRRVEEAYSIDGSFAHRGGRGEGGGKGVKKVDASVRRGMIQKGERRERSRPVTTVFVNFFPIRLDTAKLCSLKTFSSVRTATLCLAPSYNIPSLPPGFERNRTSCIPRAILRFEPLRRGGRAGEVRVTF